MTTLTLSIEGSNDLTLSVSTGVTQADLSLKEDKVAGKGLSTNDFTNEYKQNLDNQSGTNTGDQDLSALIDNSTDTFISEAKIEHVISLTQAEYDAIITPDENTLYYIPTA